MREVAVEFFVKGIRCFLVADIRSGFTYAGMYSVVDRYEEVGFTLRSIPGNLPGIFQRQIGFFYGPGKHGKRRWRMEWAVGYEVRLFVWIEPWTRAGELKQKSPRRTGGIFGDPVLPRKSGNKHGAYFFFLAAFFLGAAFFLAAFLGAAFFLAFAIVFSF